MSVLPILKDRCSPLPPIPPDFEGSILDRPLRKKLRSELFELANQCSYCGAIITHREATIDHMIPTCRGGIDAATNLVLCCSNCNSSKGDDTAEQFLRRLLKAARELRQRFRRARQLMEAT